MTIALTGGTGFLGTRVLDELLARGHDVRCLIRASGQHTPLRERLAPALRERLEVHEGTLDRVDGCRDFLRSCDTVVHVAAPLTGSTPSLFANGVLPTRRLVDAAVDLGVRRFVLISSLGVYGSQHLAAGATLDETCPVDRLPHRRDPYTFSKIAQEDICWRAHHERALPLVVIRPGVLFGPGRPLLTARIGLMIGGLLIRMDGRQQVPYCFVDNCARAVAQAVDTPDIDGLVANVVDDDLPSADEVLRHHRRHQRHTGSTRAMRTFRIPAWGIARFARACESASARSQSMFPPVLTPYKAAAIWKRLRYSNALAKARLGWMPHVPFDEAVRRTVQTVQTAGER